MPAIEVQGLVKRYGARTAVDGISFTIDDGEIVGFLGPNGAGKSTTLRILTCFQPATAGVARVAGYDVFTESVQVRENMGYLPESTPLYTEMRVRDYLDYRATLKGVRRRDRRAWVESAMERCHVSDVADRIIGHLSKGYRQRVGLADALVHRPKVLILDEPTSGLDPNQVRDVRDLVKEISGGTTVLFSTHTIPWVEQVCRRAIVINRGKIVADGTLPELRRMVEPWSRVEFRVTSDPAAALRALEAVPGVLLAENLTAGGEPRLRILAETAGLDGVVSAARAALGGGIDGEERSPAAFEDLFTKLTRGRAIQEAA
ncbi:MAG: Vitamin B12 import ATP-binding protein BtuD [Planctomycetes bacterium]|nr:Vitamin B12 import ATP-binding protein BtuD [Planctomycetota bacterium]